MHRIASVCALLALVGLPLGWALSDRLESNDAFCGSCHLEPERPLHAHKLDDFTRSPPQSLAAAHRVARPPLRCIDCHGGASLLGRARVKVVSARDAARYLLGRFEEPESMRHPLWEEDCAKCHRSYRAARDDAFHAIEAHNVGLPHACVECHRSHPTGGTPDLDFLSREVVLPVCRNCHEEF